MKRRVNRRQSIWMITASIFAAALFPVSAKGQSQWETSGTNIYYNAGNVGIGTIPSRALDVNGVIQTRGAGSGGGLILFDNAAYFWRISQTASGNSGKLQFTQDGIVDVMTLTGSGNVGIGTTSPVRKLTIDAASSPDFGFYTSGTERVTLRGTSGYLFQVDVAGATRMTIDGSGNVGIGTTNPAAKLSVIAPNNSINQIEFGVAGQDRAALYKPDDTNGVYFYSAATPGANKPFHFFTGGTGTDERVTILGSGNVGIGTSSPAFKLDVFGPEGNYPGRVSSPDGYLMFGPANAGWSHFTTDRPRFYFNTGVTVDTGNIGSYSQDLNLQTSGTTRLTINNSTGNVGIGATPTTYKLNVGGEINATALLINGTPISSGSSQWTPGTGSISYNDGKVGIGVPEPVAKLDVAGAIRANNHLTLLPWYNLGEAPQGPLGHMQLVTPIVHNESNMFSIKIKGYRYGTGGTPVEIRCGGYAYSGSTLINTGCHTEGTSDPVGIGLDGNNKVIITIGSSASTWYYDHFTAEYSGWTPKDPDTFVWQFVPNAAPATTNTNNVIVNDSAGTITTTSNVGIGTTSPSAQVNVNQDTDIQATLRLSNNGISGRQINIKSAAAGHNGSIVQSNTGADFEIGNVSGALSFMTNNANRFYVTNAGNVGIGTTDPSYKLDVAGQIRSSTGGFMFPDGTVQTTAASGSGSQWTGSGSISYSGGNVGIGTSSPQRTLDLGTSGQLTFGNNGYGSSGSPGLFWFSDNTNYGIYKSAGSWSAPNYQQLTLNFDTGIVIDGGAAYGRSGTVIQPSGGNVGIGTTSPTAKLHVFGGSGSSRLLVLGEGAGTGLRNLSLGYDYNSDYGWLQSIHDGASYTPFVLQAAGGNVGIGTATPGEKLDVSGTVRASGQNASPSTGAGVEISYASNTGYIQSFDRNAGSNRALYISGSTVQLNVGGEGSVAIGAPSHSSQLDVNGNINVNGTGNITAAGTIEAGNIKAKYQDVAEWVESSEQLAAGTVVVLDSTKSNQVISSSVSYDTRVAGVISAQPGITLGEQGDNKVLVATTGRVKVKVDASKSPIRIGDLLVTSDVPGVAMKSEPVELAGRKMHMPGTLIGKALEPLEKGKGEILVLLSLQ